MDKKFPEWVRKRVRFSQGYLDTKKILEGCGVNTVCREAACPNIHECFEKKYATFLILGPVCTRNCRFCNVLSGTPEKPDELEPERVAEAVTKLGLKHVVITSVTRDDLEDGGSSHFAKCVEKTRKACPETTIEVLIPDFKGRDESLKTLFESRPDIISHNVETVPGLYPFIRQKADYSLSLEVLRKSKSAGFATKSSIMLGLGETEKEVLETMKDLRKVLCDYFVIGQYLCPGKENIPVKEFIRPEKFEFYRLEGESMGFKKIFAGTFYRSSYLAEQVFIPD